MPPARARRPSPAPVAPAAPESSPALPPAVGEAPPDTAEAGVRVTEVGGGAVEDRSEVEREEATGAESVEEPEEDDPEEVEEADPEEAEDEAEEGKGNEAEIVLAVVQGDGPTAAAESEKTVAMEGGGEEEAIVTALKDGGGEDTVLESVAVVVEPAKEDEGQEQAEELETQEEENLEDDAMEEDATVDDMNELPEEHEESGGGDSHGDSVSVGNAKDLEIFVGGLPKDCTEDDITAVFSQFGEIVSTKIIKPPARKKNKCIAFIRYISTEAAKKALAEFKDGVEVTGKRVKVSASQANNTLYLRNICKSWTKEQVVLALKSIGIKEFEMSLPGDPDTGGQNRGISFLKFAAPDTAKGAFQQLQQPDALIDIGRCVKEYAQTATESSQELAMKVKAVYLKHVPLSWDEENIKECCKSYGEIQEVKILKKSKKKSSFVEFSFRKSALACVEGINSAKIGGEVKLAASLARPRREIHLNKSAKGGFKVNSGATSKDANSSIKKKDQKKEVMVKKSSHKFPKGDVSKLTSQLDEEVPQASNLYKGKRKAGKTENTAVNERLLKKARKNRDVLTKPSNRARHGGYATAAYAAESSGNMKRSVGPQYVTSNESHPIAGASSRSKPNARDLEPHAGYIPPVNHVRAPSDRVHITYVYDQPRAAPPNYHYIDDLPYAREIAAPPPAYSGYTSNPHYQGDYVYTYLPPPHLSRSDHPRSSAYSPPRRYY
ncbi:unnamed protein product [Alopecurus aequalis]